MSIDNGFPSKAIGIPSGVSQAIGLYVHVPFCRSKCAYCDFASCAGHEADMPRYVDAVIAEIKRRSEEIARRGQEISLCGDETGPPNTDTIFIGGGPPSLLGEFHIKRLLGAIFANFRVENDAEITCECNPESFSGSFARSLRDQGANRLSLGAQASQPRLLRLLCHIHMWEKVVEAVETARNFFKKHFSSHEQG